MTTHPDDSALRAKKVLFGMFVAWFILDALLVAISGKVAGIVRLLLTLTLMYFVLQGHRWARNVAVGLFVFSFALIVGYGIWIYPESPGVALFLFGFAAILAPIPSYMVLSKDLARYLTWKRSNAPL